MVKQLVLQTCKVFITPKPTNSTFFFKNPTSHFSSSVNHPTKIMASNSYKFGPYKISEKEVFYTTQLSYAMVNLRPLVPGHILYIDVCHLFWGIHFEIYVHGKDINPSNKHFDIHAT
ncbi:hypothetical protein AQUCO_00400548v1 [Aquilegia coerulea]|uniref:HIT domain-containing protein n=1 Tax=Aquilegia coerulea TaxID=218851 RepID=A0A2G5EVI4_AQUCA|nr:hypothetical protein AQUCO_00400548v1 [Aquilegia coerulea]